MLILLAVQDVFPVSSALHQLCFPQLFQLVRHRGLLQVQFLRNSIYVQFPIFQYMENQKTRWIADQFEGWPGWVEFLYYVVVGIAWIFPARLGVRWMNAPDKR